jgi:hypothetical protein
MNWDRFADESGRYQMTTNLLRSIQLNAQNWNKWIFEGGSHPENLTVETENPNFPAEIGIGALL